MNFGPFGTGGVRPDSPAVSSRAASPQPRNARPSVAEDLKADKALRRYAATIERTLATWEIAPEEWADYIAFLSRLLKAVQSGGGITHTLPHSTIIASKLAQCLNPGLPSGVHQKALEVYSYVFSTFGEEHVSACLDEYLPGLFPLLSFAALSVRPALYALLEDYVVRLRTDQLRPVLKSFILSLLPALEDETSEDFDRAFSIIVGLENAFCQTDAQHASENASFWWQNVYLAIITSPSRRQGVLNYMTRRTLTFAVPWPSDVSKVNSDAARPQLSQQAEAAVTPDPGLLIRAFACGLLDSQVLIQRGFLDLLTASLPLHSPVLQQRVGKDDLQLLCNAAISILLRRDMSLNRRIWQWFLGPEAKDENGERVADNGQLDYFTHYGMQTLQNCLVKSFEQKVRRPGERARAFRICLSLMDRWEIGGNLVPHVFLPAMRSAFAYSTTAFKADTSELIKSVGLFFDGVESRLIWSNLFDILQKTIAPSPNEDDLQLLFWIVETFNVREEEMVTIFAPLMVLYTLAHLASHGSVQQTDMIKLWRVSTIFTSIMSAKSLTRSSNIKQNSTDSASILSSEQVKHAISQYFRQTAPSSAHDRVPFSAGQVHGLLSAYATKAWQIALDGGKESAITSGSSIIIIVLQGLHSSSEITIKETLASIEAFVQHEERTSVGFETITAIISVVTAIDAIGHDKHTDTHTRLLNLEAPLSSILLQYISPTHSRHSVEATRLLWRVDNMFRQEEAVRASLQCMLSTNQSSEKRMISVRTFLNLWNLSSSLLPNTAKSPMVGTPRRASGSILSADVEKVSRTMQVLLGPLNIVLDILQDPADPAFPDINLWLNYSQHAETIMQILIERIDSAYEQMLQTGSKLAHKRAVAEAQKNLLYTVEHLHTIVKTAQLSLWITLNEAHLTGSQFGYSGPAASVLARHCLRLLPGSANSSIDLHHPAINILRQLVSAPAFILVQLQASNIKSALIRHLLACLDPEYAHLQPSILQLTSKVISLQPHDAIRPSELPRASLHIRRISVASAAANPSMSNTNDFSVPVQPLVSALKKGLSTPTIYPYLDAWLEFLADTFPVLSDAMVTSLIPLTEILCTQIMHVFEQVAATGTHDVPFDVHAPETTIVKLLDALEIVLRGAHDAMLADEASLDNAQAEPVSTVLNSVTPNLFKQQGNPSKTAKANNRLTVILASKDVVRVCVRIYLWANNAAENVEADKLSAATTSHVALKLRNRARHMLDGIFSISAMETLEVVALYWYDASTTNAKGMIMSLLHALQSMRPKSTVPAILDALCSRTNPGILSNNRQSTLTSDLSPAALVLFYSAYIGSLEDDALDEIWSDCTAFMRDVLSNPLPYRLILPVLLWIALQLAEKLENTNFGEKKRMRRELGDNFQRLLTATFTAIPSGSLDVAEDRLHKETAVAKGLKEGDLVVILREIVVRAETLLETGDRVAACINAITTYVLTPTLRSKTFPARVSADILALTVRIAKKLPSSKLWRRDVTDALNDARFVLTPAIVVERQWFPIIQQLVVSDKERMTDVLSRLSAPSSAGIMFGVGANAARLDADRKTQLNLRRISLLVLGTSIDSQVEHLRTINEKMVELFDATTTSSPSSVVKAELFMLIRALLLSISPIHFAAFWPIVNINLKQTLLSMGVDSTQSASYNNNLSLLQACKLLDLLVAIAPEEFQLHEWLFITNTTDAVYHTPEWSPVAISDQLADSLAGIQLEEDNTLPEKERPASSHGDGTRGPLIQGGAGYDTEDIKALSRDVFISNSLTPFLSQLSIHIYESRYRMETADMASFRHALVEDLQDAATIIT